MSQYDGETIEDNENIYIKDPNRGLALVSKLLSNERTSGLQGDKANFSKLNWLLEERLLGGSKVNVDRELDFYRKITNLTNRLLEQKKIMLLQDKCVIGIGGSVSAGKTKFINSLVFGGSEVLPEDQNPCTAIPTYIVKGSEDDRRAFTVNNREIVLDEEAVRALAHAFYKKYNIGFSNIITNIVINSKNFTYNNIAILDTPGHNNVDSDVMRNISDAEKARMELRCVDYLIWLVNADKGCIHAADLQFINSLNLNNPPLIVLNKADLKSTEIDSIVNEAVKELKDGGFKTLGVIAYSSMDKKEFTAEGKLDKFFRERNKGKRNNVRDEINSLVSEIKEVFEKLKSKKYKIRNSLKKLISDAEEPMRITSLVTLYSETVREINDINYSLYITDKNMTDINRRLDSLGL